MHRARASQFNSFIKICPGSRDTQHFASDFNLLTEKYVAIAKERQKIVRIHADLSCTCLLSVGIPLGKDINMKEVKSAAQ